MLSPVTILAATPVVSGFFYASDVVSGQFDWSTLISTGITPVAVVLLIIFGKLHTDKEVKRLESDVANARAERDSLNVQLQTLQTSLVDRIIPALTRATLVLETLSPILQTEVTVRRPRQGSEDG